MTRCRADAEHQPTALMAEYYGQRAGAGLIITEGVSPSPDGLGYTRIPGLFTAQHVAGWRPVTEAVHARGGRIFVQLMHTGRASVQVNMPAGARVLAPSAIQLDGEMWTDAAGLQPYTTPQAMSAADIAQAVAEFATSAELAIEAGFDGVELHGANGYLLEQFLNTASNQRTDQWGGSVENRARFALETARAVAARIGAAKLGIRLSPYGAFNGMQADAGTDALYTLLARELGALGLAVGKGELVAFGRPFLANPDLVRRLRDGLELAQPDFDSFYTPGAKGYTDYPALA
jgi:N-ethylmaleimide reductase